MNQGSCTRPSQCVSRPDTRLAAEARPERQVREPASPSERLLVAGAEVAAPSRQTVELRLLAAVGVVALEAAEVSPCRQTCRPEAMLLEAVVVAEGPSEPGLHPAGS